MKTQLKTEVKGIAVEMSLLEAMRFIKDPSYMQTEVRTMLRGGGVDLSAYEEEPEIDPEPGTEVCPHCLVRFKNLGIHLARGCKQDPARLAKQEESAE